MLTYVHTCLHLSPKSSVCVVRSATGFPKYEIGKGDTKFNIGKQRSRTAVVSPNVITERLQREAAMTAAFDELWSAKIESLGTILGQLFKKPPAEKPTSKSFPDCTYVAFKDAGVELCFDKTSDGSLSLAAIHFKRTSQSKTGTEVLKSLPHQLQLGMTGKSVVELLGEPSAKGGGGRLGGAQQLFIVYKTLGLQITFDGRDWNDPGVQVVELCFAQPP